MQIATSPTRERYPLSYKKIIKKTLLGSMIIVMIFLILLIPLGIISLSTLNGVSPTFLLIVFILLILIIFTIYSYQRWYFEVYFYDLTNDYIIIKKGPITPKEITIPYERVQDIYVDQDILDRIFRIYDVHVSSATMSSGAAAHIDGVEKQAADGLRTLLLDTVRVKLNKTRQVQSEFPKPPQ